MALIGGGSATPKGQIKKKKKKKLIWPLGVADPSLRATGAASAIPNRPMGVVSATPKKLGPHNSSTHCLHYPIPRLKSHQSTPQPTKPPKHKSKESATLLIPFTKLALRLNGSNPHLDSTTTITETRDQITCKYTNTIIKATNKTPLNVTK
jgi:hypothetical protein